MLASPADLMPMAAQRGLSERVAEQLAEKIASNVLPPGVRLQPEAELARQLGVSRTVVREAVSRLKSDGLLESRQGIGVFVRNEAMRPLRLAPLASAGEVLHIIALRRGIEAEAAGLAAICRSAKQLQRIKKALVDIDAAVAHGGDGVDEDVGFHRTVAEASGNPYILSVLTFVGQYFRSGTRVTRANEARRGDFARQVRDEHRAVVSAIEAADPVGARRAAARHMDNAAKRIGFAVDNAGASQGFSMKVSRND